MKDTKTKRSRRWEAFTTEAVEALRSHCTRQRERHLFLGIGARDEAERLVFDRLDASPCDPNELSRKFSRLIRKTDLPRLRLHDLRHTYAMCSIASGNSLHATSQALGHSSTTITEKTYVRREMEEKRARARRLSERLARKAQNDATGVAISG